MISKSSHLIVVDAHVHLRNNYKIHRFIESLIKNFEDGFKYFENLKSGVGVLFVVDGSNEDGFEKLSRYFQSRSKKNEQYRLQRQETTDQSIVLLVDEQFTIIIIAGSQIVAKEKIEILSVGTPLPSLAGKEIKSTITKITEKGALPILPWGVGKWVGKRGRILEDLIKQPNLPRFFISDSGNRPKFWPKSSLFRIAKKRGIKNLPGSDPLPVRGGYENIGLSGFRLDARLDMNRPYSSLKTALLDPEIVVDPFVKNVGIFNFFRQQLMYRIKRNLNAD